MRISTSQIYEQQTFQIDNLNAQQVQFANELSTGKSVNVPSDDPGQIAQDIAFRTDITVQTQVGSNLSNAAQQMNSTDSALSNVTNVLQSARSLAIEAASDTITPAQQKDIAAQIQQLLQETVGFANTQYAGQYVFAGTASPTAVPVQLNSAPITTGSGYDGVIHFSGNDATQSQVLPNGTSTATSLSLRQAFNFDAPDGSSDVFQVLQNLYNTLEGSQVVDQSSSQVNVPGQAVTSIASPTPTTVAQMETPGLLQTPLKADSAGNIAISIASASSPNGTTITFTGADTITSIIAGINAQSATTGVTASFNAQTQNLALSGAGPFTVTDVPSAGATTSGNFTSAFNLQTNATTVNDLSRQLGDIDHVTGVLLSARAQLGASIQQVQALTATTNAAIVSDTAVQSGIEDTNIAKVSTQFTQTQTALQAAYGTTSQLEQKSLFDYIT